MERLIQFLTFVRIIDSHDGQLSLSNLAVIIVLVKLIFIPAVGLTELGTLFVALLNYASKKVINKDAGVPDVDPLKPQVEELSKTITEIESKMTALSVASGMKNFSK